MESSPPSSTPKKLSLEMLRQPDDWTCGPTCLHAVYRYYEDLYDLEELIGTIPRLDDGGTLAVSLGYHALSRGYEATIYTFNLKVFDPTWFPAQKERLVGRLRQQMEVKVSSKLRLASQQYIDFLQSGGTIHMEDLRGGLLRRHLRQATPILTGLSATYLYGGPRERADDLSPDDITGIPQGHFVVICGYDSQRRTATVADPYRPNPLATNQHYEVHMDRLVCAILLGVLTYDANLLVIRPRSARSAARPATHHLPDRTP